MSQSTAIPVGLPLATIIPPFPWKGHARLAAAYRRGVSDQEGGYPMRGNVWSREHGYEAEANAYEAGYQASVSGEVRRRHPTAAERDAMRDASGWRVIQ